MKNLRIIALSHDLGKVFDRKNHQRKIVEIFKGLGIRNKEIITSLEKFHKTGNGKPYLYLVKYSDQYASKIQRVNTKDFIVPEGKYYDYLEKNFLRQLSYHVGDKGLKINSFRRFIEENQILEQIPSDVRDAKKTSLRKHLLLTDQVFCLLLKCVEKYPCPISLYSWVRSERVDEFLRNNTWEIPNLKIDEKFVRLRRELDIDCASKKPKFTKAVVKLNSYGWRMDKIALHFGIMESEVRDILNS